MVNKVYKKKQITPNAINLSVWSMRHINKSTIHFHLEVCALLAYTSWYMPLIISSSDIFAPYFI